MVKEKYYTSVAEYYDADAGTFDERYSVNPVLQKIRSAFREEVSRHSFKTILEIGFGTGIDICYFASKYPNAEVCGIDISEEMHRNAEKKVHEKNLDNVTLKTGTPEQIQELFPGKSFDHIFVFFGALNTVADLKETAKILRESVSPEGAMVISFVNKWYLADMLIHIVKLRPSIAFRRLRNIWGGYSDLKRLESRCYSTSDIRRAFGEDFVITGKSGYSILYPAWYRLSLLYRLGERVSNLLWRADMLLNKTPFRRFGEYSLYTFRPRQ